MKTLCVLFSFGLALAADFPQAEISNGIVKAKLYLPDSDNGYYRGTRFDWAGVIPSLEFKGHNYFGQWFERYDPKLHDAIMGPVEEFLWNGLALGYAEAKPGETFVKIGVGGLRKPDESAYKRFGTYEIAENGKWTVHTASDHVEFVQELTDASGYSYVYRKTVRLTRGKPEMVIEHNLKNTGKKLIETSVYNHNFYMLDAQPTGPDFLVKFPFAVNASADFKGLAETSDKQVDYLKVLETGQSAASPLLGFGDAVKDYDIRVENSKLGVGVRQVGDRPIESIYFWSIRTTVCPEVYIHLRIEPGQEESWKINYEFYTFAGKR